MSKLNKKELLRQLLELEDDDVGDIGLSLEKMESNNDTLPKNIESIDDKEDETVVASLEKPKKKLTEKQLEALKKGQDKRNENRVKNKLEKDKKEEEERKILEEKLVKKAIAVKKKQIKKQALLDEISDDETPIEKVKAIAMTPVVPVKPVSLFKFF
jgi:hypothetical protein